jgi:hypothetical protein
MKQTAVEWLEEMIAKMEAYGGDLPPLMIHIKQAKEMEKQQIIEAYEKGFFDERNGKSPDEEKYYNETYGK